MAKKNPSSKKTKSQESDIQKIIDELTPEEQAKMQAFYEEFNQMPEDIQNEILIMFQQLCEMSDEEREEFFSGMDHLDELEEIEKSVRDNLPDNVDLENYPHFLPRHTRKKFTLRVTLRGCDPKVYRKFNVPSNITLRHLSELILKLMGWYNEHLNQFRKGDNYYAPAYQRDGEDNLFLGWSHARNYNQEDYTLSDILNEKGKSIEWEYDFGDSWLHDVRLSSIGEYKEDEPLVSFVKGEGECPPEDCGGIWGYAELLELWYKKKNRKRLTTDEKERLEWYGMTGSFDPDFYDIDYAYEVCEDYCK